MFNRLHIKGQTNYSGVNNAMIYIHIGDSNQGGPIVEDPGFDPKYQSSDKVKIFYKVDRLVTDNGSWQYYSTRLTPIINRYPGVGVMDGSSLGVGPDQAFVYALTQDTTIKKLKRYIKVAVGGSTLLSLAGSDNDWNPALTEVSELFRVFTNFYTRAGLSKLVESDGIRNPKIAGIIVRLGTNDCKAVNWNQSAFNAAVAPFIAAIKSYLGRQDIPFYWVQMHDELHLGSGWNSTDVNECIAVLESYEGIGAFTLLNYDSDTVQADKVHYDIPSFLRQGEEEANTLIALGE